jgi:hypothetical protein
VQFHTSQKAARHWLSAHPARESHLKTVHLDMADDGSRFAIDVTADRPTIDGKSLADEQHHTDEDDQEMHLNRTFSIVPSS